jgi:glycerophosphoryl diester phosphodiesterase
MLIMGESFAGLRRAFPHIPTLEEALDACAGLLVNVEIKCLPWEPDADTSDHAVVRAVGELVADRAPDSVISSFALPAVDACRVMTPALETAWLTSGQEIAAAAEIAAAHGHGWLHPDREAALAASPAVIDAVHARGLLVDVWTVDEPGEMQQLAAIGVDAVVTNVPDVAVAAFANSET